MNNNNDNNNFNKEELKNVLDEIEKENGNRSYYRRDVEGEDVIEDTFNESYQEYNNYYEEYEKIGKAKKTVWTIALPLMVITFFVGYFLHSAIAIANTDKACSILYKEGVAMPAHSLCGDTYERLIKHNTPRKEVVVTKGEETEREKLFRKNKLTPGYWKEAAQYLQSENTKVIKSLESENAFLKEQVKRLFKID